MYKTRRIWKGDILVAGIEELEEIDASEIHGKKTHCKGSVNANEKWTVYIPNRRWNTFWRRSGSENIHFYPGQPRPRRRTRKKERQKHKKEGKNISVPSAAHGETCRWNQHKSKTPIKMRTPSRHGETCCVTCQNNQKNSPATLACRPRYQGLLAENALGQPYLEK